MLTMSLSK
ncbi:hypothetical protein E2C01_070138 [Portunus trituberculatus]|uniref:Uncharacterized protein n=1 Tax=Portunus trituberculatus TaxID=210409 RepID=A0A5B7I4M7_PORTR|nr:hypothetical protein [Portunus trituberculatus]